MVRNSRFKLKDDILEKLFNLFFEIVGNQSDKDEFRKIIIDLLSPAERIMISKRIAIIYLLLKNINYYYICDAIKVSPSTIAKFNLMMEKSEGIVPAFKTVIKKEKIKEFLEELFNDFYSPGIPGVNWKAAWERKRNLVKRKTYGI